MKKILLIILLLVLPMMVMSETIVLQDGTVIKGKIVKMNDEQVVIETFYGRQLIRKFFIKSIEYESLGPKKPVEPPPVVEPEPEPKPAPEVVKPVPPAKIEKPPVEKPVITPPVIKPKPEIHKKPYKRSYPRPYKKPYKKKLRKHDKVYFQIGFIGTMFGMNDNFGKQTLGLYGISFKLFQKKSWWAFGIDVLGSGEREIGFIDDSGLLHEGNLNWSTVNLTYYLRYPSNILSPYIGIGVGWNFFEYVEKSYDYTDYASSYYYSTLYYDEEEAGNEKSIPFIHADLGVELYLAEVITIGTGVRIFAQKKSDDKLYKYFNKPYTGFYFNFGLNF